MAGSDPNPDLIYSLVSECFKPQVLRLALLLNIFTPLADEPMDAASIAKACQCDPAGAKRMLDYLVSLKVLTFEAEKYELSPSAKHFLLPQEQSYVGDMLLEYTDPKTWNSLVQTIQSGRPEMLESEISFAQDAWLESYRDPQHEASLSLWKAAGVHPKNMANFRLLDLACGCAIKSFALATKFNNVWVTCLDYDSVLEAARDLAKRLRLDVRVTYLTGDLLQTDLGHERYEACLLGQISHYLTEQQNRELFKKINRALVKGGTLLIDAPMENETGSANTALVNLLLWASSGGGTHSFKQYQRWLGENGFSKVKKLNDHAIAANK